MRTILHLWTTPPDTLAKAFVKSQKTQIDGVDTRVEVIDLSGIDRPDYAEILERILSADSVTTW